LKTCRLVEPKSKLNKLLELGQENISFFLQKIRILKNVDLREKESKSEFW